MGFLIFAARKLLLKSDINRKQYQLMQVSIDLQRTQEQMASIQEAKGMVQDVWSMLGGNNYSNISNIFQATTQASQAAFNTATENYNKSVKEKGATSPEALQAKQAMEDAKAQAENASRTGAANFQAAMMASLQQNNNMNSIFAAGDKAMYAQLHLKDQRLTEKKASLESQLSVETAELEQVEKAESQAAKESAPKFGIS